MSSTPLGEHEPAGANASPDHSAGPATGAAPSGAGTSAAGASEPRAPGPGSADAGPSGPGSTGDGPSGQGQTAPGSRARSLRRSRSDRKLAGVCGGLGAYTNTDPIIFRVLFAVFTLFGGFGLLLYGVAWLFVPEEGQERSEAQHLFREGHTSAGALWAIAATVVGFLIFVAIAANKWSVVFWLLVGAVIAFVLLRSRTPPPHQVGPWWTAPPTTEPPSTAGSAMPSSPQPESSATGPAQPTQAQWTAWRPAAEPPRPPRREPTSPIAWLTLSAALATGGVLGTLDLAGVIDFGAQGITAAILIVLGLGLLATAWYGRARSLIAVGTTAVVALVIIAAVDVPLSGGFGERHIEPLSAADLASDPVRLAAGKIVIDLTNYDQPAGSASLNASVGAGQIVVIYPEDIRLDGTADVSAGNIDTVAASGLRVNGEQVMHEPVGASRGNLHLTLDLGAGTITFEEADRAPS